MPYQKTAPDRISEAAMRAALGPDEDILWHGRPRQGLILRRADVMFIPFSLIWGGVSILLAFVAFENGMHPLMLAAVGTLALVGVYAIFLRYPVDALIRSRTFYALTATEAVVVSGVFHRKVAKIRLDGPEAISFGEHMDGTGTVVFGTADLPHNPDVSGIPAFIRGINAPKFEYVPEPELVYGLIAERRAALTENAQVPVP